ncbi:MAG: hypothetical protein MUE34_00740 [Acidimicrobiales bacterium]|jgi:hypothetical protein|nr:hypothetical protein [Acidimicrobiales bacterium]
MTPTSRPSTAVARTALAVVTITLAVLVGGADRADAAVVPGAEPVVAAAVGVDIDARWFGLFAVAFLLIPARPGKGAAGPRPAGRSKRPTEDPDPGNGGHAPGSRTGEPLALPAASLDDLDAELATAVLQVWAERPVR